MNNSYTPLPPSLINFPEQKTPNDENSLKTTLTEAVLVFILLMCGLIIEMYMRGLFSANTKIITDLTILVVKRSFIVTIIFVYGYRTFKSISTQGAKLLSLSRLLDKEPPDPRTSFLLNIFITLAAILVTIPVRPILQEADLSSNSLYISQAFVKYDAIPSLIILTIPTIPLLYLLWKHKKGPKKIMLTSMVALLFCLVGWVNNQPNYDARVYESRANWITQNWEQQGINAQKALSDAQTNEERAIALYWLGVSENRRENYNKAREYLLSAIQYMPEYAAAHASLANSYIFLNKPEEAHEHAKKCVAYEPNYAWCYFSLANYYGSIGVIDSAIKYAEKAVQLDPYDQDLKGQLQSLRDHKENIRVK